MIFVVPSQANVHMERFLLKAVSFARISKVPEAKDIDSLILMRKTRFLR